MKLSAKLLEKLISLSNGNTLSASALNGEMLERMRTDGALIAIAHGSHKCFRAANPKTFREYLESTFDIRNLEDTLDILKQDSPDRATQVAVTGDSKFKSRRTFKGFLVNSFQPINAILCGNPIVIFPPDGSYLFIADYEQFTINENVIVIGLENAENFRQIKRQEYLFEDFIKTGHQLLFVSRYPQNGDLISWLKKIPNNYIHFGDLDLAGISIYQTEFFRHLGTRATFFVPKDYEERISNGNPDRYTAQFPQYGKMQAEDSRLKTLLDCIHFWHRGYDQEGFIR